jgi:hypothetical protein
MSAGQMTSELRSLEKRLDLEILDSKRERVAKKTENYEQFEADLRKEAADMAELYEVFYCLENSIRRLVSAMLFEAEGVNWWDSDRVNEDRIKRPCKDRRSKEVDHAVTPRSDQLIDYTTFGELSQLITDNWDLFETVFASKKAVSKISAELNLLRGPIAHCNPTDALEKERLALAVKSWFLIQS